MNLVVRRNFQRNESMKISPFIILLLIALRALSSFAAENDLKEALWEANNLARAFLKANNMRDGIEHVGGPFSLKDYDVSFTDDRDAFTYNYKSPMGHISCEAAAYWQEKLNGRPWDWNVGPGNCWSFARHYIGIMKDSCAWLEEN